MDASYAATYDQFEQRHWWFVARRAILCDTLDRRVNPSPDARWLDVGCGGGGLLQAYTRISDKLGVDVEPDLLQHARARGLNVRHIDAESDLSSLAADGRFDLLTACDVLEHLDDDRGAAAAMVGLLRPGGALLATVPALDSLWSPHDVSNHHRRRYRRRPFQDLLSAAGLKVTYCSYFCGFLLPAIWLARQGKSLAERLGGHPSHDLSFGPAWRDRLLQGVFAAEAPLLRHGRLPLGSSLLAVGVRPGSPGSGGD